MAKHVSPDWIRAIVTRATELLAIEDTRLEGLVFEVVQYDADAAELTLEVKGPAPVRKILPGASSIFRTFFRRAVEEDGETWALLELESDRYWPLVAYSDPEAEVVEIRSSVPPPAYTVREADAVSRIENAVREATGAAPPAPPYSVSPDLFPNLDPDASPDDPGAVFEESLIEAVEHPAHYNVGGIEVWDATDEWGLGKGFNRGSAIKYIARAGHKAGADELEDLKKAAAWVQHEIERVERERRL